MDKFAVKDSDIQGKGVYAILDIIKGEMILEIDDSHVVTDPSKLSKEQNEYDCDYLQNGRVILMQEPEKYINHCCDPNVYIKTFGGIRRVIAIRDIKNGEEIVYDYSINGNNDGAFKCRCGSSKCRGTYQGNYFKLPIDLQVKYLPYLADWFIAEHKAEIEILKRKTPLG